MVEPTDEMIERLSRNLYYELHADQRYVFRDDWEKLDEHVRRKWRNAVKDALRAALAVAPTAGEWRQMRYEDGSWAREVEFVPTEADATPDEAFELGRVAGYDEAMREVAAGHADEGGVIATPTWPDGCRLTINELAHGGDEHIDCSRPPVPDTEEG